MWAMGEGGGRQEGGLVHMANHLACAACHIAYTPCNKSACLGFAGPTRNSNEQFQQGTVQQVGRLVFQCKQPFCDASISATFAAHRFAVSSTKQKFTGHFLNATGGLLCNLSLTFIQQQGHLLYLTPSYNLLALTLWLVCCLCTSLPLKWQPTRCVNCCCQVKD